MYFIILRLDVRSSRKAEARSLLSKLFIASAAAKCHLRFVPVCKTFLCFTSGQKEKKIFRNGFSLSFPEFEEHGGKKGAERAPFIATSQ